MNLRLVQGIQQLLLNFYLMRNLNLDNSKHDSSQCLSETESPSSSLKLPSCKEHILFRACNQYNCYRLDGLTKLLFLILVFTFASVTMASSDLVAVSAASNRFANKLYQAVAKPEGNVFCSPISAHIILALAYQGSAGQTAKDFESTLEVANKKLAASGYKDVMTALNDVDNIILHMANKIFVKKDYVLKNDFKKTASELFLSEAESVNFGENEKAAGIINQWVEEKTNSKIKDLISASDLNALTRLVLVNAIYFKGDWAHQFKKEATMTEPFFITSDNKVDCQMMHIKRKFNYCENENLDAKILEMPYVNERVSMVIILPNAVNGIKDLEKKLVDVDLSNLTNNMMNVEVSVSLPKFKMDTTMDLEPILKEMGLGIIFDEDKADFSEIAESNEQLYVSKVIQKAFIEVNEEGAEAAAATAIEMVLKCAVITTHKRQVFVADHPFIFYIHTYLPSGYSDNILFYGKVVKPEAGSGMLEFAF